MEPARITPLHHVQVTAGGAAVSTSGPMRQALDDIKSIRNPMSSEDLATAADAATAALVHAPTASGQVALSYGLSRHIEVGVGTTMDAVRLWTRWQFFRMKPGFYGAFGVGVSTYLYGFPIGSFTDRVDVTSFGRREIDVPVSFGYSGRAFHAWLGPKLVLADYDAHMTVCAVKGSGQCNRSVDLSLGGTATYLAAQFGLAVGWRRFWVAAELTVARVNAHADLSLSGAGMHLTHTFDRKGLVLSPAVGIITWF